MERNYLICTASDGTVSYMPLDTDILTRTADGYTLNIYGASDIKLTVKNSDWPVNVNASFDDVKSGEYYVLPIRWAVAKGITTGTSQTTFSPTAYCTRAHRLSHSYGVRQAHPRRSSKIPSRTCRSRIITITRQYGHTAKTCSGRHIQRRHPVHQRRGGS